MRKYTSFYWLDAQVFRTVFEAETDGAALREHEELGPNAYDDCRLVSGEVETAKEHEPVTVTIPLATTSSSASSTKPKDWRDHVLITRAPGVGSTIWARRQSQKVPLAQWDKRSSDAEYLYRLSNLGWDRDEGFRPFRAPHHSISVQGMRGAVRHGWRVMPGELSLAHGGVLFMDEASEFTRDVIAEVVEAVKCGSVLQRLANSQTLQIPAEFRLIAATNPCPCGWHGVERRDGRACRCSLKQIDRYLGQLEPLRAICRELSPSDWLPEVEQYERKMREAFG